jgi:hypothetical protein
VYLGAILNLRNTKHCSKETETKPGQDQRRKRHKGDAVAVEHLDQRGKDHKWAQQAIDFVDDHNINFADIATC